jgi:dephospho-CoA kinase
MLRVGLTGGYATGKSFVADALERLGCLVIYADRLGHAALEIGAQAYGPAVEAFGPDILRPDGSIDRKILASRVFGSPELLRRLNSFVHPAVFQREKEMLDGWEAEHPRGVAVIEAAILIETGRHKAFDRMIVTTCDPQTQVLRGMERDHLTRDEVLARLARQMASTEKEKYAHYIIDTNGTQENTLRQVGDMFHELKRLAEGNGT